MNSLTYITEFEERDTSPLEDGPSRNSQIVALAKRILPPTMLEGITDCQILRLHTDFMRGIF